MDQLQNEIGNILGLSHHYKTILIGAGNLGRAVSTHMSFSARGFDLIGIFDRDTKLVGSDLKGITVRHIDELVDFCREHQPVMAVLCIPKESVAQLAETLYGLGIKSYWNFSHYDLSFQFHDAIVENVHMSDSLMTLCYRISDQDVPKEQK